MIQKIVSIKNFGVYTNYAWPTTLKEFQARNLIYGPNYSGKTTLSRIFTSLKNRELHSGFKDAEFTLICDGKSIKHSELDNIDFRVEVFNSEYIKENLSWEQNEKLNAILFDVGENVKLREEIEENRRKIEVVNGGKVDLGKIGHLKNDVDSFVELTGTKFTAEAKRIKNDLFDSSIEFTKSHLSKIVPDVINNLELYIILSESEVQSLRKASIAKNSKSELEPKKSQLKIPGLYHEVKNILNKSPEKTEVEDLVSSQEDIYRWVKQGVHIHSTKDKCQFCDSTLDAERLKRLNAFFSNAAAKVKTEIGDTRTKINSLIIEIENYAFPYSVQDFTDSLQSDVATVKDKYKDISSKGIKYLHYLLTELERKEGENLFVSIDAKEYDDEAQSAISGWADELNSLITNHNLIVTNFSTQQNEAREKYKKHLVAKFLKENDYLDAKVKSDRANNWIKRYKCYVEKVLKKNQELESQLKSIAAGKEQLNFYIQKFLNKKNISIEVTPDDKFKLVRGKKVADHLSEGEKTAISFAYFLVSLESLHRNNELKNTIVFIDDPISSLDSNHISHVYSVINSFFFRQNLDPENPNAYVECCRQLFISTHNFEFYGFLKQSNRIRGNNKRIAYYFIHRKGADESEIQDLPKALSAYKSEYIYLFDIIYRYYADGCLPTDERVILIPNAVRRFLEIYTSFKLPDSTEEIDSRLKKLLGEPNSLKLLHHFSHFTNFDKISHHDEMLMNLPDALAEFVELLEKDQMHYESLKKAIGVS
ncbi:AAA family ATPase [Chitinophaga sp. GCM10012297]|uniref:AAA family ATPase n=1 Tax=Chitinophaga chungangae TaxID=2821488 RepID=A0ABS3Y7V6_9BACT|nr:AAA family ATPase [Chitinophaga chungangae]MBO9150757.1 AAA family ATPase [Chitinophaga chungangae]